MIPGQPQHVILRGNNRAEIFCAEADYLFFLEKLQLACEKHGCEIHAYVLMTNHVHLLITPHTEQSLSKVMQMVGRYYVQHFNYRYRRTGTLFEGRYKATLIDTQAYLLTCMRYIELNPVRAGMVSHPSAYPWSSYGANAAGLSNALVTPNIEYRRLGTSDWEHRMKHVRQHIASYSNIPFLKVVSPKSGMRPIRVGHWARSGSSRAYKSNRGDELSRWLEAVIENRKILKSVDSDPIDPDKHLVRSDWSSGRFELNQAARTQSKKLAGGNGQTWQAQRYTMPLFTCPLVMTTKEIPCNQERRWQLSCWLHSQVAAAALYRLA